MHLHICFPLNIKYSNARNACYSINMYAPIDIVHYWKTVPLNEAHAPRAFKRKRRMEKIHRLTLVNQCLFVRNVT